MGLTTFQIDAFADSPFQDNPTAVCPLDTWLDDEHLQVIVEENNLSEIVSVVGRGGGYRSCWFTPQVEVGLCGYTTLATAWVLIHGLNDASPVLRFATRSGKLSVRREDGSLAMDFPARRPRLCATPDGLLEALGIAEAEVLKTGDYLVVVDDEKTVAALAPDFTRLRGLPCYGVAVIAHSRRFDFVSCWFGLNVGVNEDPVTGSAYTPPAPYWVQRLDKTRLNTEQGRARRGRPEYDVRGKRVVISGKATLYMGGMFHL